LSKSEETDEKNSKSTDDARIDKALKRKMERKKKSKAKKAAKQQKLAEVAKEEFYENMNDAVESTKGEEDSTWMSAWMSKENNDEYAHKK